MEPEVHLQRYQPTSSGDRDSRHCFGSNTTITTNSIVCTAIGCLILISLLLITTFGFISYSYESRFIDLEARVSGLETEISLLVQQIGKGIDIQWLDYEDDNRREEMSKFLIPIGSGEDDDGVLMNEDENEDSEIEEIDGVLEAQARITEVIDEFGIKSRKKRQVPAYHGPVIGSNVERSKDGVAILEGAYTPTGTGSGAIGSTGGATQSQAIINPTESEGLRLYESLRTTGGQGETKAVEFINSDGSNLQPYHRTSAAWIENGGESSDISTEIPKRRLEVKSGDGIGRTNSPHLYGSGATASRRYSQSDSRNSGERNNVLVRNSRVPSTGDFNYPRSYIRQNYPYPPLRKIGRGDGEVIARVHQERRENTDEEDRSPDEAAAGAAHGESAAYAVSRTYKGGYTRQSLEGDPGISGFPSLDTRRSIPSLLRKDPLENDDELNIVKAEAWAEGPKTIAAHFVADPSNFSTSHRHYEGNGRLRNADGIFSSWKASDWMSSSEGSKEFNLSPTGVLTVKKEGLYWIYAQIHYLDHHDINGFIIQINTEPFLQCTQMTETSSGTVPKSNSCFTGGVYYIKENDRILIRDIETNRFSIIKPEKSFFGLMRIGDVSSIK